MEYILKYCSIEEQPKLINFIDRYWKKDHIFVKSKTLFDFQHYNKIEKKYEFYIGLNPETGEIDGVTGIIPTSQYDPELLKFNETWGGIWKTRPDVKNDGIGLLGLELVEIYDKFTSHGGFGMSKIAYKFFKRKGYKMCELNQYYILNSKKKEFQVAFIPEGMTSMTYDKTSTCYSIKKINDIESIDFSSIDNCYWPRKSHMYLINRFKKHPYYVYDFYGIYDNSKIKNVLVVRKCHANNSSVLRIVDVIGCLDNTPNLWFDFQQILSNEDSEYIDLMNFGIPENIFNNMGFEKLDPKGEIIIPNYFEPFEQKNVVLTGCYRAPYPYTFFRADADQDRPNIL